MTANEQLKFEFRIFCLPVFSLKLKDYCCFVWVWNLVSHTREGHWLGM